MMLMQNGIGYFERSDDPWVTAQKKLNTKGTYPGTNKSLTLWYKNHEINLLGCVDQYQVCNPNKPGDSGCTKLGGILSASHQTYTTEFKSLGFNAAQTTTISRFLDTLIRQSTRVYGPTCLEEEAPLSMVSPNSYRGSTKGLSPS
jgi:hypothetical protein